MNDSYLLPESDLESTKIVFALNEFWINWIDIFNKLSFETRNVILWLVVELPNGWLSVSVSDKNRIMVAGLLYWDDI